MEIYEVAGNKFADNGKVLNGLFTSALLSIDWNQGSDLIAAVSQAY